jgi:hypothetical protein
VAEISKLGAETDVKGAWRFPERRQLSVEVLKLKIGTSTDRQTDK